MGKIRLDITEDAYSKLNQNNYELSILVGMDSFTYMLYDDAHSVVALKEFAFEGQRPDLSTIIKSERRLHEPFQRVRIGWMLGPPVLLPARLYNPLEKRTYLQHLQSIESTDEVFADHLPQWECRCLYSLPHALLHSLQQAFPNAQHFHLASALLLCLPQISTGNDAYKLMVHLTGQSLVVILAGASGPVFCNAFSYKSAEDFLYYVLLALEQQSLDNNQIPLYISGRLLEDSAIFRLLQRYFKHIYFAPLLPNWKPGPQLQQEPTHFYFDLMSIAQS